MLLLGSATDSSARYWVGGDGIWSEANTANWSYYSGGPGGAPVPTSTNNVYFDANSDVGGPFTVRIELNLVSRALCKSLYIYPDQKIILVGKRKGIYTSLGIYGDFKITSNSSLIDVSFFEGGWLSTEFYGAGYIDTHGIDLNIGYFGLWNAANYTLLSDLNLGIETTYSYLELYNSSTFNTNNYTLTCFYIAAYTPSCTLIFGTSTVYTSGSTFDVNTATLSISNATIYFSNYALASAGYIDGGWTANTVYLETTDIDSSSYFYFNLPITVTNLYIRAPSFGGYTVAGLQGGTTVQNLIFLDTGPNKRVYLYGEDYPSTITVTSATNVSDIEAEGITIAGSAAPLSGTRIVDRGTNSGITFSTFTPKTVYWSKPTGGTLFDTAYAATSGGIASDINFPFAGDTVIIDDAGLLSNATIVVPNNIFRAGFNVSTIDSSTRTMPFTITTQSTFSSNLATQLDFYIDNFKFPNSSYLNFDLSLYKGGINNSSTGNSRLRVFLGNKITSSNINITGNYTGTPDLIFGGTNNYTLYTNITAASVIIACNSFNANGFNVTTSNGVNFQIGNVTFGSGIWTGARLNATIAGPFEGFLYCLDSSPDLEIANFIFRPISSGRYYNIFGEAISTTNFIPTRNTRRINSIKIEPQQTTGEVLIGLSCIIPRSIEITSSIPFTLRFDHKDTNTIYEIDSFIVNGPTDIPGGPVIISGSPTKFLYTKRGSISLNNVSVEGIIVYPSKNWYAVEGNIPMQDQNGWIFDSTIPAVSSVDSDNIVTASQSNIVLTGTNLSTMDGVQLRQGNNILNTSNFVAGSSPTFTAPTISQIFSSGIKFGSVQLDIMENI